MDIYYDVETKELLDLTRQDQQAALRALHLAVGVTWCECHKEQIFYRADSLGDALLAHERLVGFSIKPFDNAVVAHNYFAARAAMPMPENETRRASPAGKRDMTPAPETPEDFKRLLDGRSLDLQLDLETRLGYRLALNALAQGTLRRGKQGTPALAVIWYRLAAQLKQRYVYALREANDHEGADRAQELGAYYQKRLEQYCGTDTQLTRQIFEYGVKHRRVFFWDVEGERRSVKVDWR